MLASTSISGGGGSNSVAGTAAGGVSGGSAPASGTGAGGGSAPWSNPASSQSNPGNMPQSGGNLIAQPGSGQGGFTVTHTPIQTGQSQGMVMS